MPFLQELKEFLSTPLYLGKLCDWGMIFGALSGLMALFFSLMVTKDKKSIQGSLAVMAAAAILIFPSQHFHQTSGPLPTARAAALQSHNTTRKHNAWMFYVQAVVAGLAFLFAGKTGAGRIWWITAAIVGALSTGSVALWTQLKELEILAER